MGPRLRIYLGPSETCPLPEFCISSCFRTSSMPNRWPPIRGLRLRVVSHLSCFTSVVSCLVVRRTRVCICFPWIFLFLKNAFVIALFAALGAVRLRSARSPSLIVAARVLLHWFVEQERTL